jgi:hypothetical protein
LGPIPNPQSPIPRTNIYNRFQIEIVLNKIFNLKNKLIFNL